MKKHLNRINQIEEQRGLAERADEWLARIDTGGKVELTKITAHEPQRTTKTLTASEFEVFKKQVGDDRIVKVEWA